MSEKIKPQTQAGEEYTEVRKVSWDMLWHVYYITRSSRRLTYDRVDKKTALNIANRI